MKVLIAGWLAGGAFIVLLSLWPKTAAVAVAEVAAPVAGSPLPVVRGVLLVPVSGISPSALRDNFTQPRGNGRLHHAIDIMAPHGTPVVAAVSGTIRKLFTSKGGGLTIYQFDEGEEHVYYYAHLQRYADGIAEGTVVEQGTVIGYVGVTGNSAKDAPHLHFSVEVLGPTKEWWKGTPLNPYPLLTAR